MPISTIGSNSLNQTSDLTINGVTVGKGAGSVSTNTAVGASALAANTTGVQQTAIGANAGASITTSSYLSAVGYQAAYYMTDSNDAFGRQALYGQSGATGYYNCGFGNRTLYSLTTGNTNAAFGTFALQNNTTASGSTAVGYQAGYTQTVSTGNTFLGYRAGYVFNPSSGDHFNTFVGYSAGSGQTSGFYNTYVGLFAGNTITTGQKNTILGGYNGNQDGLDIRTASNYVVLSDGDGNRAAYWQSGGGWVQKNNSTSWSTYSDQRIKENIVDVSNGLSVITELRPVEFDYKIGDKKHDIGFIAQEYKNVLPNQIHETTSGGEEIQNLTNGEPLLNIQQNLVPYLVSAIKELKTIVDAQTAEIAELKARLTP